jgi:hypothetical protein
LPIVAVAVADNDQVNVNGYNAEAQTHRAR